MPASDLRHIEPGTLIDDRYEIIRAFGEGGFATVYEARQTRIDAVVALKVLRMDQMNREPQLVQRFLDEAKATASINHPNIVKVHDFGTIKTTGQPYIAMERLFGHELKRELVDYGPIDPVRAFRLFRGALAGLGHSHNLGIVHKDLKPSNLFLSRPNSPEESLIVMDFGIARAEHIDSKTVTGSFVGTPRYYAPEYIREQVVTPALDVYQMGLILIEMLVGKPVVETNDPFQCIHDHCTGSLKLPVALMEGSLGPFLRRMLKLDHRERYSDGYAVLKAFRTIDPTTIESTPSGAIAHNPAVAQQTGSRRVSSDPSFQASVSVPQVVRSGQNQSVSQVRPISEAQKATRLVDVSQIRASSGSHSANQGVPLSDISQQHRPPSISLSAKPSISASLKRSDISRSVSRSASVPKPAVPSAPPAKSGLSTGMMVGIAAMAVVIFGLLIIIAAILIFGSAAEKPDSAFASTGTEVETAEVVEKDPDEENVAEVSVKDEKPKDEPEKAVVADVEPDKGEEKEDEPPEKVDDVANVEPGEEKAPADSDALALCSGALPVPEGATTVTIALTSNPPGASLFSKDDFLGLTPCRWIHAQESSTLRLNARHPTKQESRELDVDFAKDGSLVADFDKPDDRPATKAQNLSGNTPAKSGSHKGKKGKGTKPEKTKPPVVIGRER